MHHAIFYIVKHCEITRNCKKWQKLVSLRSCSASRNFFLNCSDLWMFPKYEDDRKIILSKTSAAKKQYPTWFRHVIRDPSVVREFPVYLLHAMSVDSTQPAKGPWSVTLHPCPIYTGSTTHPLSSDQDNPWKEVPGVLSWAKFAMECLQWENEKRKNRRSSLPVRRSRKETPLKIKF